jgi:hypothetical protein
MAGRALPASCWFLACLFFEPLRGHIPPKCRFTFNGLHGVMSQKIELFTLCSQGSGRDSNLAYPVYVRSVIAGGRFLDS